MISVLFVDDEPMLLSGLRRMLRPMREQWQMSFAESADQAIGLLASAPFDVVVSDIRMPGRSGVDLLTEVSQRWPHTVRIILSGEADLETACHSVRVSHQFLSKPSDLDVLRATITRACRLQATIGDPALARMVGAMANLPSLPQAYGELMRLLDDPACSAEAVGQVINRDISMAASVLRLVNSAYFSLPRLVTNAGEAARLLGFDLIKTLVLGVGIFSQFDGNEQLGGRVGALCTHSVAVASRAREIAARLGLDKANRELACMAGMLHDIGELVLTANHPEAMRRTFDECRADGTALWAKERALLGASHMEVGAYLLALWGLHDSVVEAAAFHHQPSCIAEASAPDILTAVHLANHCVAEQEGAESRSSSPLDNDYLASVGALPLAVTLMAEGTAQAH